MKYFVGIFLFYASLVLADKNSETSFKKWPNRKWILGHRGARANTPENTLIAFRKAMEYGADGVEFDVFLSSDGVPVVIHDDKVDRTTDGDGAVADLSAKQLSELNAAHHFPGFERQGIPTLEKTLGVLPDGAIVNVELKENGHFSKQEFVEKLIHVLDKHQTRLTLIISSFDGELLALFRQNAPDYLVGLLLHPNDKNWPKALKYMKSIRPNALHLPKELAGNEVLFLAKRKNMHIAIWTVNDPKEARAWFSKGVDGIVTDKVKEVVDGR